MFVYIFCLPGLASLTKFSVPLLRFWTC